LSTTHIF